MSLSQILRFDTPPARLRAVAFIEGLSYLALLLIAMPLKYLADLPLAVRIVGGVHGFLFVWLALATLSVMLSTSKSIMWGARIGIASLIPFGTFFLDRDLGEVDADWRSHAPSPSPSQSAQ